MTDVSRYRDGFGPDAFWILLNLLGELNSTALRFQSTRSGIVAYTKSGVSDVVEPARIRDGR